MRVIAGSAKRLRLKTIEGNETRPTTDRIKETLFNMLADEIYDCRFLDLFAGSGGIGIEALSRGAKKAVFVEKNPKAVSVIKENLAFTHLEKNATVLKTDALHALKSMDGSEEFDLIFMDPPYNHLLEKEMLTYLATSALTAPRCLLVIEASLETDFSYVEELGYKLLKEKNYKTNKHIFLEKE